MSSVMDAQRKGDFAQMSERDREIQASLWSLIFLVAELSLSFRVLRNKLTEKGILQLGDEEIINSVSTLDENLQVFYQITEGAFRERYDKVLTAMDDPEGVAAKIQELSRDGGS